MASNCKQAVSERIIYMQIVLLLQCISFTTIFTRGSKNPARTLIKNLTGKMDHFASMFRVASLGHVAPQIRYHFKKLIFDAVNDMRAI